MARREEINAFLGTGTTYEGNLSFQGSVRIDGSFKGEIESKGTLITGKEAQVNGVVKVGQFVTSGTTQGEVIAKDKAILHKTAHLTGQLTTPKLVIEEGAIFEGTISMKTSVTEKAAEKSESSAPAKITPVTKATAQRK